MQIGATSASSALLLNLLGASHANAASDAFPSTSDTAKSAASVTNLPSSGTPISFESILALQSDHAERDAAAKAEAEAAGPASPQTAEEKFLDYAQKSPAQRMRDDILKSLGLTEDDLAKMTPEERGAVEEKIKKLIEEKFRQGMHADAANSTSQTPATELQELLGA
ncbi:MAG: hypothetical protein QM759_16575 [Terricaulis sp.]